MIANVIEWNVIVTSITIEGTIARLFDCCLINPRQLHSTATHKHPHSYTAWMEGRDTASSELKPVEQDPSGRYLRVSYLPACTFCHFHPCLFIQYPLLLGRGACKTVYRGIDIELGIEIAWNQVMRVGMRGGPA